MPRAWAVVQQYGEEDSRSDTYWLVDTLNACCNGLAARTAVGRYFCCAAAVGRQVGVEYPIATLTTTAHRVTLPSA